MWELMQVLCCNGFSLYRVTRPRFLVNYFEIAIDSRIFVVLQCFTYTAREAKAMTSSIKPQLKLWRVKATFNAYQHEFIIESGKDLASAKYDFRTFLDK